ncbi:hypothetical protein [Phenylobacterium sp.]|uniref:hypothetical protein n=1 Tax=Phenylobacterium sp. TaxID=1871053 RepID=UPI0025CD5FED|nr:hypothetical protein [Phenylobacterium sp.]
MLAKAPSDGDRNPVRRADRSRLDAGEAAFRVLDDRRRREEARLRAQTAAMIDPVGTFS